MGIRVSYINLYIHQTLFEYWRNKIRSLRKRQIGKEPDEALIIQGRLHRHFLIFEWVLREESRRIEKLKETNPSKRDWALEKWQKYVNEERQATNASLEQLESMAIPPKPLQVFSLYWNLPETELRNSILSFLTEPEDKLNLLKALPVEGRRMKWKKNVLEFEVEFIRQLAKGELSWRKPEAINLLRITYPQFREIINKCFEDYLTNDLGYLREIDYFYMQEFLPSDLNAHQCQYSSNPFTGPVTIELGVSCKDMKDGLLTLQRVGAQIWDLVLVFLCNMKIREIMERIQNCLKAIPNVRKLLVWEKGLEGETCQETVLDLRNLRNLMKNIKLPRLRFLKVVRFEMISLSGSLVRRILLERYGMRLYHLSMSSCTEVEALDIKYRLPFACPHLSTLVVKSPSQDGVMYPLRVLSRFNKSPLTVIDVQLNLETDIPEEFGLLLNSLSRNFGSTLRELSLFIQDYNDNANAVDRFPTFPALTMLKLKLRYSKWQNSDHYSEILTWFKRAPLRTVSLNNDPICENQFGKTMSSLNLFWDTLEHLTLGVHVKVTRIHPGIVRPCLERLKTISLQMDPLSKGWKFFLMFPSLEQIVLTTNTSYKIAYHQELIADIFSSSIWKWLTELNEIVVKYYVKNSNGLIQTYGKKRVTRDECIMNLQNSLNLKVN